MVMTQGAIPQASQASASESTFQKRSLKGNSQGDIIPETPQEGLSANEQPQDKYANAQLYDENLPYELIDTPDTLDDKDKIMADTRAPAALSINNDNLENAQIEEKIAQIEAFERRAYLRQKLQRLQDKKSRKFPVDNDLSSKSFKKRLAVEQTKSAKAPEIYSKKNQRAFDKFFYQLDLVFKTKPLTYGSEKDKCVFVTRYLAGVSSQK